MKYEPVRVRWWRKLPPVVRGFVYASLALGLIIAAAWPYRFRIISNDGLAWLMYCSLIAAFFFAGFIHYWRRNRKWSATFYAAAAIAAIVALASLWTIPNFA